MDMYEHFFSHCATVDCVFWLVHCTKRIMCLNEHFNFFFPQFLVIYLSFLAFQGKASLAGKLGGCDIVPASF